MTGAISGVAFRYLPIVILAVLWQMSTGVLPPLTSVFEAGWDLITSDDFWGNAGASLYRGSVGLLLAIVIGAALGIGMAWWRPVRMLLSPIVEIFYPLPKSALIPVTALWLGFGDASKILLIFLGCMLPVTIGAFNGARGSERILMWSARSMGASRLRVLWDGLRPSVRTELLNG